MRSRGTQAVGMPSRVSWTTSRRGPKASASSRSISPFSIGLDPVRRLEAAAIPPLVAHDIAHRGPRRLYDPLRPHYPGQRPLLLLDGFLEEGQAAHEGIGARGTALDVDVYGEEGVDPLHDAVDVVHSARARAGSHRDHPAWLHHLLPHVPHHRSHLLEHRAGDDHDVGLPRGAPDYLRTEAGQVEPARKGGRELHVAAGEAEVERPDGAGAAPGEEVGPAGELYV